MPCVVPIAALGWRSRDQGQAPIATACLVSMAAGTWPCCLRGGGSRTFRRLRSPPRCAVQAEDIRFPGAMSTGYDQLLSPKDSHSARLRERRWPGSPCSRRSCFFPDSSSRMTGFSERASLRPLAPTSIGSTDRHLQRTFAPFPTSFPLRSCWALSWADRLGTGSASVE